MHEPSRSLSVKAERLVIFSCIEIFAVLHANCVPEIVHIGKRVRKSVMFVD